MKKVFHSKLGFSSTPGDGWGEIAVPVIQEHPGTAIIFVPWQHLDGASFKMF